MGRIFIIIAAISAIIVLLTGGGSYWFSAVKLLNAEKQASASSAKAIANTIEVQLATIQQSIDGLARSPEVIAALSFGDPNNLASLGDRLQFFIPGALKVRLLLPATNQPDQSSVPNMGFGDLEMVRSTLNSKQKPVIQGEGPHRHLAFTSPVKLNDKVIGVILASINADIVKQALPKSGFSAGLIEINQDKLLVATIGDQSAKIAEPNVISLANNSRWSMNLWTKTDSDLADTGLIISIIIIPALLSCLIFFIGYRKLLTSLLLDQSSILKAARDLLAGKVSGNYPIVLKEMHPVITKMMQFKRINTQENFNTEEDQDPGLFDESFDLDFLEEVPAEFKNHISQKSIPISMPTLEAEHKPLDFDTNKD
jgi:phosphomannomutase/phosphoglucomutase